MEFQNTISIEKKLSVPDLLHYIVKKVPLIVAVALVFAAIGYVMVAGSVTTEYTASTEIYIIPFDNLELTEAQFSTIFINDCKALITGINVADAVIEKLDLDMSASALISAIEIPAQSNCRVVQIKFTDSDPELATAIANAIREEAVSQIESIMNVKDIRLVYEAAIPNESIVSASMTTVVLAMMAGIILSVCVLAVIYLLDETIRTEADVADCLGVRVLGAIPDSRAVTIGSAPRKN